MRERASRKVFLIVTDEQVVKVKKNKLGELRVINVTARHKIVKRV